MIKLIYFDLRARAEPARLLLAYAGQDYQDERIPWISTDEYPWQQMKPSTPFGQLPLLVWNGETISQSISIARFLATEFGLAGRYIQMVLWPRCN